MEERRREEEQDRLRALPDPEQMARQFLTAEAGEFRRPEDVAAAAERAYLRLRERLSVVLGHRGFDALWARAMYLARQKIPWEGVAEEVSPSSLPHGLHAAIIERGVAEADALLIVAFASFMALLCRFIGEELGFRFIRQIWPELPPAGAGAQAEGTTQ